MKQRQPKYKVGDKFEIPRHFLIEIKEVYVPVIDFAGHEFVYQVLEDGIMSFMLESDIIRGLEEAKG